MPKYGPHLPGIEKKVRDKLAELNLTPKYVFDAKRHRERFYTAPCRDKQGGKVIFKMRTEDYGETKESFRREIEINRLFSQFYKRSRKLSVPKFIDGDSEHAPEWMVYEFIEGYEAGDFYNGLSKSNIKNFPLESLISGMKNMQKMTAFAAGEIRLAPHGYEDFRRAYREHGGNLSPFFSKREIAQGEKILRSQKELLDAQSVVITHGDFHPGNLIITPEREIAVIDWYYVHLDNRAFDIAFLYLEITDKKFRKKLLEKFAAVMPDDAEEFWRLFRLDVLRLAAQKISVLRDALYMKEPQKEDYYAKLTVQGIAKLETNLEAFRKALDGEDFL